MTYQQPEHESHLIHQSVFSTIHPTSADENYIRYVISLETQESLIGQ